MKNKYNSIFYILAAFLSIHVISSEVLANTQQGLSDSDCRISHEGLDQGGREVSDSKETTIDRIFQLLGKVWNFIRLDYSSGLPLDFGGHSFNSQELNLLHAFAEASDKKKSISVLRERIDAIDESNLLSEESIELRESLVKEIEALTQLYLGDVDCVLSIPSSLLQEVRFQHQTALAELKALLAKKLYDAQRWDESIENAQAAVEARREASKVASQLGWAMEASVQLEYAEWPGGILAEARLHLRKEKIFDIQKIEVMCTEVRRNIESLGEEAAYSNAGFNLRRRYLELLKTLRGAWMDIEDIQQEKEVYFLILTVEAEMNNIQSKRFYDLGLFSEARVFASNAIDKREAAFHCARMLGWSQDALLQIEYKEWSVFLFEQATSAYQSDEG